MMKSMAHLLVDGYNLMHFLENRGHLRKSASSLEDRRQSLVELLSEYQIRKQVDMSVVFDANDRLAFLPRRTKYRHLMILFAAEQENADQMISELCQESPGEYVVVSNDEEVIIWAQQNQCLTMSCAEFAPKLQQASRPRVHPEHFEYEDEEDDDRPLYPKVSTKKKGVAKRLPKGERRRKSQLKNF